MSELRISTTHNPIDMDGIPVVYDPLDINENPWPGELSNYIQELSIVFSGKGAGNDGTQKGETVLTNLKITEQGVWSFSIKACHPLTGDIFTANIAQSGRSKSWPVGEYVEIYADIKAHSNIEISKVSVLPTAVKFIPSQQSNSIRVDVKTISPLISSILDKKLTIDIDTQLNKYVYGDVDDRGIKLINGIRPLNGNININGRGKTIISVASELVDDNPTDAGDETL